jgi:hypothetical protein
MILTILGLLGGLVSSFLPELLKYLNKKTDNAHEIEMFRLQMQGQEQMHRDRLEEIEANADIAESIQLHAPMQSFGVQMLDKMHDSGMSQWLMIPLMYIYTFLDFLQAVVRPGITMAITGFYMFTKYAQYQSLLAVQSNGTDYYNAVTQMWNDNDLAIFVMVLSYWFGSRMAQKAFNNKKASGWS